jgi:hypothetical protein
VLSWRGWPTQRPTWRLLEFYTPLALTSLLNLLVQPIGSAALSCMPDALESLAVWPVVTGLIFMLRSLGFAYNEVVVAMLDEPRVVPSLRRFTVLLATSTTLLLLTMAATPITILWAGVAWGQVTGLCIGLVAFGASLLMQNAWLWQRSRMTVQFCYAAGAPFADG